MLKWRIEYFNGKVLKEEYDKFDLNNKHLIKRMYFTDGENSFGFNNTGTFFINNATYDFKININCNSIMIPFQSKSALISFNQIKDNHKIVSYNLGFDLLQDDLNFKYKMIVYNKNEIDFEAIRCKNDEEIDKKIIKLL